MNKREEEKLKKQGGRDRDTQRKKQTERQRKRERERVDGREAAVSGVRYGQLPVEAGNAGCDKTDADGICREGQEIAGIVGCIRRLRRIWHSVQMPDATLVRLIWPTGD